jgi:hypothetical protein
MSSCKEAAARKHRSDLPFCICFLFCSIASHLLHTFATSSLQRNVNTATDQLELAIASQLQLVASSREGAGGKRVKMPEGFV